MSCSVIVLDCNACSWGALSERWPDGPELLKRAIAAVVIYANTHLSLSVNNRLMIVAAGTPLQNKVLLTAGSGDKDTDLIKNLDESLRDALTASAEASQAFVHTNYANVLSVGICYFNRIKKEFGDVIGRIIVLNLSEESHGEQSKLMNLFLSAQQHDLKIHVCSLGRTNPMLRQASDITDGIHRQISGVSDVLQFLTRYCLGNTKDSEGTFSIQNHERIDYQASCYCHNAPVSLGFVCSVCLAVQCKKTGDCVACRTKFSSTSDSLRPNGTTHR